MPYISWMARAQLRHGYRHPSTPGELNFIIVQVIEEYRRTMGDGYRTFSEITGALECSKLEFYRRVVAPYEDRARDENGEVYAGLRSREDG